MRAEYQRWTNEKPASTTASPAMTIAICDDRRDGAVPGDLVDDPAGEDRRDHADQRATR